MSPPSHRRIFTIFTKDLSLRDLNREITTYKLVVHNSNSLTPLHKREAQSQVQSKEKIQLCDHKDYKQSLGDLKRSQTKKSLTNKILEDRLAMKSSSM